MQAGGESQATTSTFVRNANGFCDLEPDYRQRQMILAQFSLLAEAPLDGIYMMPYESDVRKWHGVVFVRRGVYSGGIFRFTMRIPDAWPNTDMLPVITFHQNIFHPSIDPNNMQLSIAKWFPNGYNKEEHKLYHVIACVRRVWLNLKTVPHIHKEAVKMMNEHAEKFKERVAKCVRISRDQIYDDPKHVTGDINAICFDRYDEAFHEQVRRQILAKEETPSEEKRVSWLNRDEFVMVYDPKAKDNQDAPL